MFKKSAPSSANRRRKSPSASRGRQRAKNSKSGPTKRNKRDMEEQTETLHAKIGALEEFIAGSPFRDRHQRFKTRDTVPPPDRMSTSAARNKRRRQPNRRELEAMRKERASHLFTFACLFAAVCAMLYWLLQIID